MTRIFIFLLVFLTTLLPNLTSTFTSSSSLGFSSGLYAATVYKGKDLEQMEERCVAEINKVRKKNGLKPLSFWKPLLTIARCHSRDMASGKAKFSHAGFSKRAELARKNGTLAAFGENLAFNHLYSDPVAKAVDGWMKSPSHKENILGDYNVTAIGITTNSEGEFYLTQLFGSKQ